MKKMWMLLLCTLISSSVSIAQQGQYDIVIRGGRIVDGTGAPWYRADLAIQSGRIVAIGKLDKATAHQTIDAKNRIVAPGFIDMHSHSDYTLLVDGHAESKIRQGVTTEVLGEHTSAAPAIGPAIDMKNLPGPSGLETLAPLGLELTWHDFNGYFSRVERQGISVNILSYVSSGQVRSAVVGFENRPPSPAELERMKTLVREAMAQGAFGLSSGLIYSPNSYMATDELIELARVAAQSGGIYATHLRGEGNELTKAVQEAITIGENGGLPVEIFHFKAFGQKPGKVLEAVRLIEEARIRGIDIAANQYPYIAAQTTLGETVPAWALEGGRSKLVERLYDNDSRKRIRNEMTSEPTANYAIGSENILVVSVTSERNRKYQGQTIAQIAKERGVSPEDVIMDLLADENGNVNAIYFAMQEQDIKDVMRLPWISIGSDGKALKPAGVLGKDKLHPRNYGTFPRVLGKYVREEKVLTLEDAIRKMTSLPASRLRLSDRGVLKAGMAADVVVFDPDRVIDRGTFENPYQYSEGINLVIVNGQVVLEEGNHTGATPGKVLRGPGYQSPKRQSAKK